MKVSTPYGPIDLERYPTVEERDRLYCCLQASYETYIQQGYSAIFCNGMGVRNYLEQLKPAAPAKKKLIDRGSFWSLE